MGVGDETGADAGSAADGAAAGTVVNCPQLVRTNVATHTSATRVQCDLFMVFSLSQRYFRSTAKVATERIPPIVVLSGLTTQLSLR